MIPARFDYVAVDDADHAIELLGKREDAKLLAGGHSLLPAMKLRLARPALLIDVGRIASLSYVRDGGDMIAIGALTRHKDVAESALLQEQCPIVSTVAAQVGDPQVRHRGTIGGSIAHGDPASDLPTVVLALDGELVARGKGGDRTIAARDFFTGVFQTALAPDEMLVEVRVPKTGLSWLVVREDAPPRAGLGDGRGGGDHRALERLHRKGPRRPDEHGRHGAPSLGGGGRDRRRSVDR